MNPVVIFKVAGTLLSVGLCIGFAIYEHQKLRKKNAERQHTYCYTAEESTVCGICLEDFTSSYNKNKVILPCQHRFHAECIKPIINEEKQNRCPYCRRTIPASFTL